MTEPSAPPVQPAILASFFTTLTLPASGLEVRIRKVDAGHIGTASAQGFLLGGMSQAGAANAREGGAALQSLMATDGRAEDMDPQTAGLLLEIAEYTNQQLLKAALVRPSFPELLALFESDGSGPDLGLGPDYTVLLNAVREHSGVKPVLPAETAAAKTFPAGKRGAAGRDGKTL
jgi:hypothetical protein